MFGNYNNFYLDYANRQAAQNNFSDALEARRRAENSSAEYDRNAMAAPGFMGSRSPTSSNQHMTHNHGGRHYSQLENNYAHQGNMAMANALHNEAAQVQDRAADLRENVVAGKRDRDRMEYMAAINKQNALQQMMASLSQPFTGSTDASIDADIPAVNIYSNGGKRIGGSSIGKSLLS